MTQQNEIRQELQKKNKQTKDKIKKQKDAEELNEFMDDLGIERVDKPHKDQRRSRK